MSQSPKEEAAMPYDGADDEWSEENDETGGPEAQLKARREEELMAIDGVEGVGLGRGEIGEDVLLIYLRDESVREEVSRRLQGVPHRFEITGPIDAL